MQLQACTEHDRWGMQTRNTCAHLISTGWRQRTVPADPVLQSSVLAHAGTGTAPPGTSPLTVGTPAGRRRRAFRRRPLEGTYSSTEIWAGRFMRRLSTQRWPAYAGTGYSTCWARRQAGSFRYRVLGTRYLRCVLGGSGWRPKFASPLPVLAHGLYGLYSGLVAGTCPWLASIVASSCASNINTR